MGAFHGSLMGVLNVRRSSMGGKVCHSLFPMYWSKVMAFYAAIEIASVLFSVCSFDTA